MNNSSGFLQLNLVDVARGVANAVIVGVLVYVGGLVNLPGFSVFTLNWQRIVGIAVISGLGYLTHTLFSTENGKLGGVL